MRSPLEVIWSEFPAYLLSAVLVWLGRLSGGVPGISVSNHNLVDVPCVPCHTIFLLYNIKHFSLSYDIFSRSCITS